MPVTKICEVCKRPFKVPPAVAPHRHTCSLECKRGRPVIRGPADDADVLPCLNHLLLEGFATKEELAGIVQRAPQYVNHRLWYYTQMGLVEQVYQLTPKGMQYMKQLHGRKNG